MAALILGAGLIIQILPAVILLFDGIEYVEGGKISRTGYMTAKPPPFGSERNRSMVSAEATRQLYLLAAQSKYSNYLMWIDSPAEFTGVLDSPLMWYWPVTTTGEEADMVAPHPLGLYLNGKLTLDEDLMEVRLGPGRQLEAISFDYTNGDIQREVLTFLGQDDDPYEGAALAIMLPLVYWMHRELRMPDNYAQVLADLRLRQIDGKLDSLLKDTGPVVLYRHPTLPILEARFESAEGPRVVRVGATEAMLMHSQQLNTQEEGSWDDWDEEASGVEWVLWQKIDASNAGPTTSGDALKRAQTDQLFTQDKSDLHLHGIHYVIKKRWDRMKNARASGTPAQSPASSLASTDVQQP